MSEHYIASFYLPEYFKSVINITKCFQKFVINITPLSVYTMSCIGGKDQFRPLCLCSSLDVDLLFFWQTIKLIYVTCMYHLYLSSA